MSTLKELQERFGTCIDAEMRSILDSRESAPEFWAMMGYHLGYRDDRLNPVVGKGGKRFRPALCLLACDSVSGEWRSALPMAAAIELLHNFSLIHDDIEDADPMRHHRPTVWRLWGEPQAINLGDGMFALANLAAMKASSNPASALEESIAFQETALRLTEGQYMDMSFETRLDVTPAEYMEMIHRKTATLIGFSAWVGAAVGGATVTDRRHFRDYGVHLGLAFQMRDDYLGIWGDPAETGKEAAQDLRKRKKTLPVLLAMEQSSERQSQQLVRFLDGRDDDLGAPLAALADLGIPAQIRAAVERETRAALDALDRLELDGQRRDVFASLARELTGQRLETSPASVSTA